MNKFYFIKWVWKPIRLDQCSAISSKYVSSFFVAFEKGRGRFSQMNIIPDNEQSHVFTFLLSLRWTAAAFRTTIVLDCSNQRMKLILPKVN